MKIFLIASLSLFAIHGAAGQDLRRADLDDELAGKRQLEGNDAAAEDLYRDALSILEKHPDDGADVRARVLGGLGLFRARQGRFDEAKDLLEKATAGASAALGARDSTTAALKSALGQIYLMQGKAADAEPLLKDAVEIQRAGHGSLADRVVSEAALGAAWTHERRYSEAEPMLQQAVEEAREMGESQPSYAGALTALADLYRGEGKQARLEPLLRKAQAIYAAAFGADSPRVAEVMLDRSIETMNERKFALAETELGEALGILRKQGPNHPTVAIAESRLAKVYAQQRRYREAKGMLEHALPILETTWPDGYLFADSLYDLAQVERLDRDYAAAELGYRKAIAAYEKAGTAGSQGLEMALRQYASLLRTNRGGEAKVLERRAQDLHRGVQAFR
jgi:tetratricopeptide (TPR) repeat protein